MAQLELKNIHIMYDDFHAVKGVDIDIGDGEIVTLLGPSGCGKTSILRCIAGFNRPTEGVVVLNGEDITRVPPNKRDMGMIWQNFSLWPHMSVKENIGYGLKIRGIPKEEREKRILELVKQVQLEEHFEKYPGQLSGGQQQRVALARAMAINPKVLLCDEPLSNLDFKLRVELRTEIRDLAKKMGITVVYVTHDQTEALAISDKIAVMDEGKIVQVGDPLSIFSDPNTYFVGKFVGENNLLRGTITNTSGSGEVTLSSGEKLTTVLNELDKRNQDQDVKIIVRLDEIEFLYEEKDNCIHGTIKHKAFMGNFLQLEVELADKTTITANLTENIPELMAMTEGKSVMLHIPPESILVFDLEGNRIR